VVLGGILNFYEDHNLSLAKRITIMIDDDLDKKLRLIQAKKIQNTNDSVSFSRIMNETLRQILKKST